MDASTCMARNPVFTVTEIDLNSPEIARLCMDESGIVEVDPNSRPLAEVIPPSKGCISEDDRRERAQHVFGLDIPSIAELRGKYAGQRLIICGGGSSLERTLSDIRRARKDKNVKILAVNKTHDWLISKGIVPDFGVLFDPREHIATYMTPHKRVKYLFDMSLDPSIYECFKDAQTYLWFAVGTERDAPFIRDLLQRKYPWKSVAMVPGPSTVGLRSVYLGMDILGFTTIELHGIDSCYAPNDGPLWAYPKAVTFEPVKVEFSVISKTDGAQFKCLSNPDMARQVYEFDKMIDLLIGSVRAGKRPFLPNITVAGDGAIPWMAWKNGGHATPERMALKYGDARQFNYATDEDCSQKSAFIIDAAHLIPLNQAAE